MRGRVAGRMIAFASLALAVVTSSTASAASASPQQAAVQQAQNPWMALSMMTPVGATALGSAGVAAQPGPPSEDEDRPRIPLPVIIIWLGTIAAMIYIATHNNHHPRPHASPD
jgi:hypothetical protein